MKTNYPLFKSLFCGLALVGLLSCQDHRIPDPTPGAGRLRVKTITQELPDNKAVISAFQYDGQGRLSTILAYQTPDSSVAPVEKTVYQYDSQNRLTQVNRDFIRRGSYTERYTLNYNSAGQLAGIGQSPSQFGVGLQYGSDNRLSGFSKGFSTGGLTYNQNGTFTFTGNNLTYSTIHTRFIRLGEPRPLVDATANTTYAFDTKINPFYGVFIIPAPGVFGPNPIFGNIEPYYTYYGGIDNFLNASQNNVLSAVTEGGTTTLYSYTYNAANLPTKRVTATGSSVTETLYIEYEAY